MSTACESNMNPLVMAQDARALIEALGLNDMVIAGWSLGGMVAQVALALFPQRVSHSVLIGTTPPGTDVKMAEPLFYGTASMPDYGLDEDQPVLRAALGRQPRGGAPIGGTHRAATARPQPAGAGGLGHRQPGQSAFPPAGCRGLTRGAPP